MHAEKHFHRNRYTAEAGQLTDIPESCLSKRHIACKWFWSMLRTDKRTVLPRHQGSICKSRQPQEYERKSQKIRAIQICILNWPQSCMALINFTRMAAGASLRLSEHTGGPRSRQKSPCCCGLHYAVLCRTLHCSLTTCKSRWPNTSD